MPGRYLLNKIIRRIAHATYDFISMELDYFGDSYAYVAMEEYKEGDNMRINTYDGNYSFGFNRIDRKLWLTDNSGNFVCILEVYDSINRMILDIRFSELFAFDLIDKLNQFSEFGMTDLVIPIYTGNSNLANYHIRLYRDSDPLVINLEILQYDFINQLLFPRIVTKISDPILEDLLYGLYFSYLIDIDCGDISLAESIYTNYSENHHE
ncbi:MAG: hypothetical protein NC131_13495 [Roseburia sp.]|nr:hypothetical protein [Roseburia sp.]